MTMAARSLKFWIAPTAFLALAWIGLEVVRAHDHRLALLLAGAALAVAATLFLRPLRK